MENNNFNPQFPEQPEQPEFQKREQEQTQPQYQHPQVNPEPDIKINTAPAIKLKTDRNIVKYLLLTLITCGIYGIIMFANIPSDLNIIASKYDGKKTMSYWLMAFILTPVTCGIYSLIWMHSLCNRIGAELQRRNIPYDFAAKDFWIFSVLLSFTFVCPLIYISKLFKAMNLLSEDYNVNG